MAKKYIDDNKEYLFNPEALNDEIRKQASKRVEKDGKLVKVTTQSEIMDNIADVTCVTKDAVNNWKLNRNGPRDVETIKDIAKVLNVDYRIFLIPLDNQETTMENEIINGTYKKCIEALYAIELGEVNKEKEEKNLLACKEIHKYIDQNTLLISGITKYKLHRVALEFEILASSGAICDRWDEFDDDCWYVYHHVAYHSDRDSAIMDDETFEDYTDCEIDLAEKLGYYANVRLPQDINPVSVPEEDRKKYGAVVDDNYGFTLSPSAVYIDIIAELLSRIFKHDFY